MEKEEKKEQTQNNPNEKENKKEENTEKTDYIIDPKQQELDELNEFYKNLKILIKEAEKK